MVIYSFFPRTILSAFLNWNCVVLSPSKTIEQETQTKMNIIAFCWSIERAAVHVWILLVCIWNWMSKRKKNTHFEIRKRNKLTSVVFACWEFIRYPVRAVVFFYRYSNGSVALRCVFFDFICSVLLDIFRFSNLIPRHLASHFFLFTNN